MPRRELPTVTRLQINFSSLLIAQMLHKACLFISAVLLAHGLGSAALGRFLSATSFVWIFWLVIDAGVSELFICDVAPRRELLAPYSAQLMRLKVWLALAALAGMGLIAACAGPLRADLPLVLLLGAALVTESYATLFRNVFRIQERSYWEAMLWASDGLLKLGVAAATVWRPSGHDPLLSFALGWVVVSLLHCGLAGWVVRRWWTWEASAAQSRSWLTLLTRSLPFVLVYCLSLVNLRAMIVWIGVRLGHQAAGYFGAGERLLEAAQILSIALAQVLLPVSARLAEDNQKELRRLLRPVLTAVLMVALVLTIGLLFWAQPFVRLVYGNDFQATGQLLRLLGWVLVPLFLKPVLEKTLFGLQEQGWVWRWYLAMAAAAAVAAVVVVPAHGMGAAAVVLLVIEVVSVAGLCWKLRCLLGQASRAPEPAQVHVTEPQQPATALR